MNQSLLKIRLALAVLAIGSLLSFLTGCSDRDKTTVVGGAAGAGIGAAIGGAAKGTVAGAGVGAVIGAIGGAVVGNVIGHDKSEAEQSPKKPLKKKIHKSEPESTKEHVNCRCRRRRKSHCCEQKLNAKVASSEVTNEAVSASASEQEPTQDNKSAAEITLPTKTEPNSPTSTPEAKAF